MKRFYLLPLLLLILTFAAATQAQTATPTTVPVDYCYKFDFRAGQQGWTIWDTTVGADGEYVSGMGWRAVDGSGFGFLWRNVTILYNIGAGTHNLKSWTVEISWQKGTAEGDSLTNNNVPLETRFGTGGAHLSRTWGTMVDGDVQFLSVTSPSSFFSNDSNIVLKSFSSSDNVVPLTVGGYSIIHSIQIDGYGTSPFPTSNCGSFVTPTPTPSPTPEPTVTYARPLISADVGVWGMVRHEMRHHPPEPVGVPQENTVLAFSSQPNAFVRAGADGTVQSVKKMRNYDCPHYFGGGTSNVFGFCSFTLDSDVTGDVTHDYHLPGDTLSPLIREMNFYEVVIDVLDSDDTLHYLVFNAPQYVDEGQIVGVGCVLGRTMEMKGIGIGFGTGDGIDIGVTTSPYGVTIVTVGNDGTIIDGLPLLTIEPPIEPPCNQADNFAGCLGDATLSDPQSWKTKEAVFTGGGVTLNAGGSIETTMNLNSEQEPEMIAYVRGVLVFKFDMQLGQTIEHFGDFDIGTGEFRDYIIPGDEHLPDKGSMFTVKIINLRDIPIEISYICVRHTKDGEGTPIDLPPPSGETGTCTFLNHNFYAGTLHWEGDLVAIPGGVAVEDAEAISQNITLEPGTYYLKVNLQLHYVNFTPDAANETDKLLVEYRYPSGDDWETAAEFTSAQIAKDKNVLTIKASFTVHSVISSDFSIRATLDGFTSNPVYGVIYKVACITLTSQDGPLVETCTPMVEPSGDAFGGWVRWLWHNQNQFFQCQLMILLNNMYNVQVQTFKLLGWSQRYSMAVTQSGLDWAGYSLLPWAAGYMANIQPATIQMQSGCNSIWCLGEAIINGLLSIFDRLFDTLDWLLKAIIQPIFDLILWLVTGLLMLFLDLLMAIIGLIFLFLIELIQLFLLAKDLLFAVVMAWNTSTPTALPGLWDCSNTTDIHPSVCWILWMLENTLFAGSAGSALIPVVVALAYIIFTIKFVKRILKMIRDAGIAL